MSWGYCADKESMWEEEDWHWRKKWSVRKQREKEEQQLLDPFLGAYFHGGTQEVLVVLEEVRSYLPKEMMKVNESLRTMGWAHFQMC